MYGNASRRILNQVQDDGHCNATEKIIHVLFFNFQEDLNKQLSINRLKINKFGSGINYKTNRRKWRKKTCMEKIFAPHLRRICRFLGIMKWNGGK
jgi:hypothetical protein